MPPKKGLDQEALLRWAKAETSGYPLVQVTNWQSSWNDGLAFCALLHRRFPEDIGSFDALTNATPEARAANFELAFGVAERRLDVDRLLDVEDMMATYPKPDKKCMVLYAVTLNKAIAEKFGSASGSGAAPAPAAASKKEAAKAKAAAAKAEKEAEAERARAEKEERIARSRAKAAATKAGKTREAQEQTASSAASAADRLTRLAGKSGDAPSPSPTGARMPSIAAAARALTWAKKAKGSPAPVRGALSYTIQRAEFRSFFSYRGLTAQSGKPTISSCP